MKVTNLLTHKIKKLEKTHGYVSTSMLTDQELSGLNKGSKMGQKVEDIQEQWTDRLNGKEPTMAECEDCKIFPQGCPTCSIL